MKSQLAAEALGGRWPLDHLSRELWETLGDPGCCGLEGCGSFSHLDSEGTPKSSHTKDLTGGCELKVSDSPIQREDLGDGKSHSLVPLSAHVARTMVMTVGPGPTQAPG